jgi:hypothetical protein
LAGLVNDLTAGRAHQARKILDGNCELDSAFFDNDLTEVAGLTPRLVKSLLTLYRKEI